MGRWGGFEGNAQTVHLLIETIYQERSGPRGMQPTRALLDGVLKYKTLYGEHSAPPKNHFLYDTQEAVRRFVFGGAAVPKALRPGERLNGFKSVECQIMDWADDAAYSLNDIVDGVKAGFLSIDRIEAWAEEAVDDALGMKLVDELLDAIRADRLAGVVSDRIGSFITACRLKERDGFMAKRTNRYRFELVVAPEALRQALFYKQLANDVIFEGPALQQMEHKARKVLFDLWDSCWRNYVEPGSRVIRVLPPEIGALVDAAKGKRAKARRICDWLAGLTDGMIVRTYRRLFDPEYGMIRDLN
jgi:dGTPase